MSAEERCNNNGGYLTAAARLSEVARIVLMHTVPIRDHAHLSIDRSLGKRPPTRVSAHPPLILAHGRLRGILRYIRTHHFLDFWTAVLPRLMMRPFWLVQQATKWTLHIKQTRGGRPKCGLRIVTCDRVGNSSSSLALS